MPKLLLFLCGIILPFIPVLSSAEDKPEITGILVQKSARKMYLYNKDTQVRQYNIRLGRTPVGAKTAQGDNKTPEGKYTIVFHNPHSAYHLSLKISYPTAEQIAVAKENNSDAGGDIMIHGYPNKFPAWLFKWIHKFRDWTAGCIAVTNREIEEIYDLVKDGTPIFIEP